MGCNDPERLGVEDGGMYWECTEGPTELFVDERCLDLPLFDNGCWKGEEGTVRVSRTGLDCFVPS